MSVDVQYGIGTVKRILRILVLAVVPLLSIGCFSALGAPPASPTHLRVCDAVNPAGTGATPYFGWYVNDPDNNEIQTRFQVLVASSEALLATGKGDLWDSGEVSSHLQNHIAYSGKPLESDHRYYWKVRTWDRDGNKGAWSDPAGFTVGLLENKDWSGASWIRRDTPDADDYTYYRKKVELPGKSVERATVYVSGVHKYALYVNGKLVGKGPAYHYPQYQYYNAYDITSLLHTNSPNAFAIFNHWFGGGQGRPESARGVIMKAIVHYADGSTTVVGTDGTWKQSKAKAWGNDKPVHRNKGEGIGYIETIDARALIPDWNQVSFDDSSWDPAVVIGPQPVDPWTGSLSPDLTRIDEHVITPVSIRHEKGNRYLVDLGKVYPGMPRIHFSGGHAGDKIEMLGGYAVDSAGRIDTAQNQHTDMHYFAVLNGAGFIYEPVEYLGMRYLEVDNPPMPLTKDNVQFVVRHSAMDESQSSFESPDATLNAVWNLMKHSLTVCAQEEFVDTPTREKGGFLRDETIQSMMAMPVMNERLLTRRVLGEFLQSMDQYWSDPSNRGRINAVYPNRDGARDIPDFTQSYLVWVWRYYMETGDKAFLSANYAKLKEVADYVDRYRNSDTGLITNLEGGKGPYKYGIVDWPASMRFGYDMTAARTVINGWAYADYTVVANIAGVLGNAADHDACQQRANALKKAINSELLKRSGVYIDGLKSNGAKSSHISQQANMFPLALGIVPALQEKSVLAEVEKQRVSVGMVTMPWLIRALGESDSGEHLLELLTNEKWLGWAQCLSKGATCTWESWYSDKVEGESMSHAWGTSGLEAYVRYILGIKPLKPQYDEVQIKPLDFGSKLNWAKGTIPTDRGSISVYWKRNGRHYCIQLQLPVNVTARIAVPKGPSESALVYVDGKALKATVDGDYLVVNHVGSGAHTIER